MLPPDLAPQFGAFLTNAAVAEKHRALLMPLDSEDKWTLTKSYRDNVTHQKNTQIRLICALHSLILLSLSCTQAGRPTTLTPFWAAAIPSEATSDQMSAFVAVKMPLCLPSKPFLS